MHLKILTADYIAKKLGETEATVNCHWEQLQTLRSSIRLITPMWYLLSRLFPTPNKTFTVKVKTKTAAHPSLARVPRNGYTIDGVEGATLTLLLLVKLIVSHQSDATNTGHPLRFYKKSNQDRLISDGCDIFWNTWYTRCFHSDYYSSD